MLTELEKFQLVNQAKTWQDLNDAILAVSDENGMIPSSHGNEPHFAPMMADALPDVRFQQYNLKRLTQTYGIRQQALYLLHYNKK